MVVVYSEAPVTVFTSLQDFLVNKGAAYTGQWAVELKLYRGNQASFKDDKPRSLFSVWVSHEPENVWILPEKNGILISSVMREILDTKMQTLWTPRQVFKGNGYVYKCEDGGMLRLADVLVQGSYKGLLIDIDDTEQCRSLATEIHSQFGIDLPVWNLDHEGRARQYLQVYK